MSGNFTVNWEEDIPKLLELVEVPEGFDKESMLYQTINLLVSN